MKKLIALLLLLAGPAFAQQTTSQAVNPISYPVGAGAANCATLGACVWMKLPPNTGTATITISGTLSGNTYVVEQSSDGGNTFTTAATYSTVITAAPLAVGGMTDIRVRCSTFSSGIAQVTIQASQATQGSIPNVPGVTDPCTSPNVLATSVAINISSATTTALVAPVAGQRVYVCGFAFTISQVVTTANTLTFITGSGATCGTNTVTNSGPFGAGGVTAAAPVLITYGGGNQTLFTSASGAGVCATTAIGATGNFAGILTFVQQ